MPLANTSELSGAGDCRAALHAQGNPLGGRLDAINELDPEALAALTNVIDGLVAKSLLHTLAGGLS